jgi:ABC-type thiamine transport system substrate-binding protein
MPDYNSMYSVRNGTDLPETDGYRFHADQAIVSTAITQQLIEQNMDDWLMTWQDAVQIN